MTWMIVLKEILSKLPRNGFINLNGTLFQFRYIVHTKDGMGALLIWNELTHDAINISRVKVPEGFPYIDSKDEDALSSIPDYRLVSIDDECI